MKKLLFLTILILLVLPFSVSAHQESKDFFDFENYAGNDETLKVVPPSGTYGNWGINNPVGPTGARDGVTSATTDKGTSMVLVRKNANYPGIYYSLKNGYQIYDSVHVSFAIKISGTIESGSAIFRFRKPANSTPYNVLSFSDAGYITIYGKQYRKDGITLYYDKDKWYYVDVIYDVLTGYSKININDGNKFNIDYEGMSGYEDVLTPIQLVMVETTGYLTNGYEGRIYLDDWLVETVPKVQVENQVHTFTDFEFDSNGARTSGEYLLTGFAAKTTDAKPFAGVFKDSLKEKDDALALCMNKDAPLAFHGYFNNKIKNAGTFEADLRLCNSIADTVISLGDSKTYEKAIRIEGGTGNVYAFGELTPITLSLFKDYHLSLMFDMKSRCGIVEFSHGEETKSYNFAIPLLSTDTISAYKLTFENYQPHGTAQMKTIFDNISLSGRNSVYHPYCEMSNPSEGILLSAQNTRTPVLDLPSDIGTAYFFGYTVKPDCTSGKAKLMLSGETDECVLDIDIASKTVGSGDGGRASFDPALSIELNADISQAVITVSAYQSGALLFENEISLADGKIFKGSYLEYEGASTQLLEVTKLFGSTKYDLDISEAFVSETGEYTIKFNNPIDSSNAITAKINRSLADCVIADDYTLKIYYTSDADANITLSNVKDIFGNVKTLTAEVLKSEAKHGYRISNPVFLAEKSGMYTEVSETAPGDITAIVNIKKAYE